MDFVTRTLQPFRSSGSLRNAGSAGMPMLMESILALKQRRGVILRRDANSGMRQDLAKPRPMPVALSQQNATVTECRNRRRNAQLSNWKHQDVSLPPMTFIR